MDLASRRILRDTTHVVSTNRATLEEQGIYYQPNEASAKRGVAMIVGKPGTPYFAGFYFFSIEFPDDYPFTPIKVLSLTQDGKTRFNPNLYIQGKVCLSILNTWHDGPQWSGVQSLESVLLAILSDVLTENPLENEPAYKDCGKSTDALMYNRLIWYANVKTAIYETLSAPPIWAQEFGESMWKEFEKNRTALMQRLEDSKQQDTLIEVSRVFNFGHQYNFQEYIEKLTRVKNLNAEPTK